MLRTVVLLAAAATQGLDATSNTGSYHHPLDAKALQAQLNAAIAHRLPEFTIPPGVYNFSVHNFNITHAVNMRVVAADVNILFRGTAGVNITNCESVHISGPMSIDYDHPPHGRRGVPGITYNLLNSTSVVSEDITIFRAPFFSVTAFNGGGGHTFRRFHLPNGTAPGPDPFVHQRDAFHFTDMRRGVLLEDSDGADFGDDFFNSHNTIMVVLRRDSPTSLLLINPHVQNVRAGRNTVYGTNCVLQNLRPGDSMRFFAPVNVSSDYHAPTPRGSPCVVREAPTAVVDDRDILEEANALQILFERHLGYVGFDPTDIWRVDCSDPVSTDVLNGSLVNIDSFSTPGTIIRNNTFTHSRYNIGRFKSNGGRIVNNTFSGAGSPNLEITPLLQYFEGSLPRVRDVLVSGNTIIGEGQFPIHCSPFCSRAGGTCAPHSGCKRCPDCDKESAWTENITVVDNHIRP